jgi:hypothetical protein
MEKRVATIGLIDATTQSCVTCLQLDPTAGLLAEYLSGLLATCAPRCLVLHALLRSVPEQETTLWGDHLWLRGLWNTNPRG